MIFEHIHSKEFWGFDSPRTLDRLLIVPRTQLLIKVITTPSYKIPSSILLPSTSLICNHQHPFHHSPTFFSTFSNSPANIRCAAFISSFPSSATARAFSSSMRCCIKVAKSVYSTRRWCSASMMMSGQCRYIAEGAMEPRATMHGWFNM